MPFELIRNDITRMHVDAIVNAANETLLGGGGVDGAIHRAAGPGLLEECRKLGGCAVGEAKITRGYDLPCRYVIHTVGPVWRGGSCGEEERLISCYYSALKLAEQYGCESMAFPLISAGVYGYPREQAMRIATDTIRSFLLTHDMTVYLVVYDRKSFAISQTLYDHIQSFIDDSYISPEDERREHNRPFSYQAQSALMGDDLPAAAHHEAALSEPTAAERKKRRRSLLPHWRREKPSQDTAPFRPVQDTAPLRPAAPAAVQGVSLNEYLNQLDEGFRDMLLRKIDESGMTDAECYKRANVDRKLFNKIKNQPDYKPGKSTVLAFAVALQLPLPETRDMLSKAGYSLSHSSKGDLIVEFFILKNRYDIYEINEALFAFDQKLLGSTTASA